VSLWSRFIFLFKAKASKALDRVERPDETLDYAYEEQLRLLQKVKRGVVDVVTAKKQLEAQANGLRQNVVKLEGQARAALGAGREDLARLALERKSGLQTQLDGLDGQVTQLESQQQQLVSNQHALEERVAAFRSQKEVVKAQYKAAEAQVRIQEAVTGIGGHLAEVGLAVQRAKDKTEQMQARAGAIDELVATGALEDAMGGGQTQLDRELAQLSSESQVDAELAALKKQLPAKAGD
jgi:phage shock protein A